MNKKGLSLNALYPAVLSIILIGIILGIGIFVLNETSVAISTTEKTVTNETFSGGTLRTAALATECGFNTFAVTEVTNSSGGGSLTSTNYTLNADFGTLTALPGIYNVSDWNVSYTYFGPLDTSTTGPCGSLETTGTGVGGLASWIAVIVVVLAAAIVLGIVISSFGRRTSV